MSEGQEPFLTGPLEPSISLVKKNCYWAILSSWSATNQTEQSFLALVYSLRDPFSA